jgi:hypothetical protein
MQAFVRALLLRHGKGRRAFLKECSSPAGAGARETAIRQGNRSAANPAQHARRGSQLGGTQLSAREPALVLQELVEAVEESSAADSLLRVKLLERLQQHLCIANGCQGARGIAQSARCRAGTPLTPMHSRSIRSAARARLSSLRMLWTSASER